MTCDVAKILLLFHRSQRSGDLSADDAQQLAQHLIQCSSCAALSRQQTSVDQAISTAIQNVPVPEDLSSKLLKSAFARQGAILRQKIYIGLLAISLVMFGGVLGYVTHWFTRPNLDSQQLLDQLEFDIGHPETATNNWLVSQRLPQHLPEPFDFRLLSHRGQVDLQGRKVACLTFQVWRPGELRPDTARVYLLSQEQFKLQNLQQLQNSFGTVRVIPDDGRGWAFLIVHTANLELFLKPNFKQVT